MFQVCMYMLCTVPIDSSWQTWYVQKWKRMYMFQTCTYMFANQWTRTTTAYVHSMYMVCTKWPINVYVHRSNMYVHVYRFMSVFELYIHVLTTLRLYKRVHAVFCSSCWVHSSHHTFHEMNRHCSTKYVHCWTGYVHCWTRYVFCWTGFLKNSAFWFAWFACL